MIFIFFACRLKNICIFAPDLREILIIINKDILRGGAVVARRAHNPKVVGSNPAPATKRKGASTGTLFWYVPLY